jgi:GTP pyrophosphokinase
MPIASLEQKYAFEISQLFSQIKQRFFAYHPQLIPTRLQEAFQLAQTCHQGQWRDSGEPFIVHPLQVALILTDYYVDEDTIIGALLHDAMEDSNLTKNDISQQFGDKVANLVDGVTAINSMFYQGTKQQGDQETIRKILKKSQQDLRVIMIKLADRLHNMRTINSKPNAEKKRLKAEETMDIFVAIAARLGVWQIKRELETLSFQILYPEETRNITNFLKSSTKKRNQIYSQIIDQLRFEDHLQLIDHIQPYERGLFAFKKEMNLKKRKKPLLNDALVLQIVVKNIDAIYLLLRNIHKLWKNLNKYEEDFVSNPRDNGYQSFHTNIVTTEGYIVQFRIMTAEMQKRHWYGIPYELFTSKEKPNFLLPLDMIDGFTQNNPAGFFAAVKTDLLGEKIEVHLNGKSLIMPICSSVLDVVFTNTPAQAVYAKKIFINNEQVSFSQKLHNGDYIKVLFNKKPTINYHWLQQIQTTLSKIEIQKYLTQLPEKQKIELGQQILQEEFDLHNQGDISTFLNKYHSHLCQQWGKAHPDSFLSSIATGETNPYEVYKFCQQLKQNNWWPRLKNKLGQRFPFLKTNSDYQLYLKIDGKYCQKFNPLPSIAETSTLFNLTTQQSLLTEKNKNFCLWTIFSTKSEKEFFKLLTFLKSLPGVHQVNILMSMQNIKKFLYWSGLAATISSISFFFWFFSFGSLHVNQEFWVNALVTALSLLPILGVNWLCFIFVKNYFTQLRQNIWILWLSITLNLITFWTFGTQSSILAQLHFFLGLTLFAALLLYILTQYLKLLINFPFLKYLTAVFSRLLFKQTPLK